jgi:hypothetical protein
VAVKNFMLRVGESRSVAHDGNDRRQRLPFVFARAHRRAHFSQLYPFAVFVGLPLDNRIWGKREAVRMNSQKMLKSGDIIVDWNPKKAPLALIITSLALLSFIFEFFTLSTTAIGSWLACCIYDPIRHAT